MNDIVTEIGSSIRLFADDTSLFITVDNPDVVTEILNADLEKIAKWAEAWLVKFNPLKTETLLIFKKINKPVHPSLIMLGQQLKEVEFHKHLGIYFSNDGSWHKYNDYIKEKAWTRINIMRRLKYELDLLQLTKDHVTIWETQMMSKLLTRELLCTSIHSYRLSYENGTLYQKMVNM